MKEVDEWLNQFRKIWEIRYNQLDDVLLTIKNQGGRRFYAMVSPEGQERWSVQKYTSISPKINFKFLNAFADENENPQLPGSGWDLSFSEKKGKTKVRVTIYNESLERMEKMIEWALKKDLL